MESANAIIITLIEGTKSLPYIEKHTFYKMLSKNEAVYLNDEDFQRKKLYDNIPGQITQGTPFGGRLFEIAKLPHIKNWIEIGAWNGLGTTQCILNGFKESGVKDQHLLSYELDPIMHNVPARNLASHPCINQVTFIHDKLIGKFSSMGLEMFPTESEISDAEKGIHFFMHYQKEKYLFTNSTGIKPHFLPQAVLLDGGEYSGYNDWLQLDKDNLEYICIDDAFVQKSRKIVGEIERDGKFRKIYSGSDKNGWVIFQKI